MMRTKENQMVMEDKWDPMTMGPTIAGSMLETCKERAVRRGAQGDGGDSGGCPGRLLDPDLGKPNEFLDLICWTPSDMKLRTSY